MKKRISKRLMSLLLSLIMMFCAIPFSAITAFAVPGNRGEALDSMHYLLATYSVLPDTDGKVYELHEGVKDTIIFDKSYTDLLLSYCEFYPRNTSTSNTYYGSSMAEFATSAGVSLGLSTSASVGVDKLFSVGVSSKFSTSSNFSYKTATESHFSEFQATVNTGVYTFNENALDVLKEHLDPNFEKALAGVSGTYDDPVLFFQKYGTHFIGSYMMGGSAGVCTTTISTKDTVSSEIKSAYEAGVNASATYSGITAKAESSIQSAMDIASSFSTGDVQTNAFTYSHGGTPFFSSSNASASTEVSDFNAWAESITYDNAAIIVDKSLVLYPIWELLPEGDRRTELYNAYMEMSLEQDISFYENYLYSMPESDLPDYTDYTIISTVEELKEIQNAPHKKYVLACNLNLNDEEWEPIGTSENPFTGTFDGNGNTISGLYISSFNENNVAGLFGQNNGTIKNLEVTGSISVDDEENTYELAYIGGIAGINNGTVSNCKNGVTIDTDIKMSGENSGISSENTQNQININSTHISSPYVIDLTTMDSQTITIDSEICVKLVGDPNKTYEGFDLVVKSRAYPAYIILENVNIIGNSSDGTIYSDNNRDIYIISNGISNSIKNDGYANTINATKANLYITGDALLSIYGSDGQNGTSGDTGNSGSKGEDGLNQVRGKTGGTGKSGSNGSNGGTGCFAINSSSVSIEGNINLYGGNGGVGGTGGTGGIGGTGGAGYAGVIGSAGAGNGGTGGKGGAGGIGGNGQVAISSTTSVNVYSGTLTLVSGNGGTGGAGGTGGKGGTGGNTTAWGAYCGWAGGGGSGGYGGVGGVGGTVISFSDSFALRSYGSSKIHVISGAPGAGGAGGHGGAVGSVGKSAYSRPTYESGTNRSSIYNTNGSVGSFNYESTPVASIQTATKLYSVYSNEIIAEKAYEKNLVSIGSEFEQELVEELISLTPSIESFWIGLHRKSLDTGNSSDINTWIDTNGMEIYIPDETECQLSNGKYEFGKAYDSDGNEIFIHFEQEEPNNYNNNEMYIQITSEGLWNDVVGTYSFAYITERNLSLSSDSTNTLTKNVVAVGGITGINNNTISNCYNSTDVNIKAFCDSYGLSSIAGGIAGINSQLIENCYNIGSISSKSTSYSSTHFADSYAWHIAKNADIAKTVNSLGESGSLTAISESSNSLFTESEDPCEYETSQEPNDPKTLSTSSWSGERISIDNIYKIEYLEGDLFNENTLSVSVNGNSNVDCSFYNTFSQSGVTCIVVKYNSAKRYVPVVVNEVTPKEISVFNVPQTQFVVGDSFNTEGVVFELIQNNGVIYNLTATSEGISIKEPNMSLVGKQSVEVSYSINEFESLITSYEIDVIPLEIDSIQILKKPDKLVYFQGQGLLIDGMEIQKVMNNGTVEGISLNDPNLTFEYDFSEVGTSSVTVFYNEYSATFDCTVKEVVFDSSIQISADTRYAVEDSTVQVMVNLNNNSGFAYLKLSLDYDEEVLELTDVTNGNIIGNLTNGKSLVWFASQDTTQNGMLVALTFKVKDGVQNGNYTINVVCNECTNYNEESVMVTSSEGTVKVVDLVYGDVTGDGEIDGKDIIRLSKYLASYEDVMEISTVDMILKAANTNNDDQVNGKDITRLLKYLANYDSASGTSSVPLGPVEP